MKWQLSIATKFRAFHVLDEREEKHEHMWRVRVAVKGEPIHGRVVSLPLLREQLLPEIEKLDGRYLNTDGSLDIATRENPTCENLALYFAEQLSQKLANHRETAHLRLSYIDVAVDEINGEETGAVRLTL